MNRRILEQTIAWLLLIIWGMIVLHAPIMVWLVSQGVPVYVKGWKEVLMIIAAVLLIVHVLRLKKLSLFMRDPILWAVGAYGLLNLIMVLCVPTSPAAAFAGLAINLRYVLYFMLVYVFVRLYPLYRESFLKIGIVGIAIVIGFACLQLFLPRDILASVGYSKDTIAPYLTVDENPNYIRENSTLRGPNPLGAYAGSVIILTLAYLIKRWKSLRKYKEHWVGIGVIAASCVALWVSYSRSALLGAIVGVVLVLAVMFARRMNRTAWLTLAVGTLVLVCLGWAIRDTSFVQNVIVHNNPTTGASVDSNGDHLNSLQQGWNRMVAQPFGAGVGSTGSASLLSDSSLIIENQYLMIAHEVGWLGLGLFIWLFYLVMVALWHRRKSWWAVGVWASGISLALIGLVLPVWADDTVSIMWWGLAGLVIALEKGRVTGEKA